MEKDNNNLLKHLNSITEKASLISKTGMPKNKKGYKIMKRVFTKIEEKNRLFLSALTQDNK